jgi:hypothetical protein
VTTASLCVCNLLAERFDDIQLRTELPLVLESALDLQIKETSSVCHEVESELETLCRITDQIMSKGKDITNSADMIGKRGRTALAQIDHLKRDTHSLIVGRNVLGDYAMLGVLWVIDVISRFFGFFGGHK